MKEKEENSLVSEDESKEIATYEKVLYVDRDSVGIDFKGIINKISQYTNILDVVNNLEKGAEFVVDIPTEFKEGFESGEYFLMENSKNGNIWPNLMEIGEDGRNKIVKPLSVKKEQFIQGNPARDAAMNFHNIYMQQQMNKLISIAEDTFETVKDIEHGQMDDRIAMIETGKQQMSLALTQKDEQSRSTAIQIALGNITVGQKQVYETLKRKVNEFKPIPKSEFAQFLKETMHHGYLSKMDDKYNEIVEYYQLYLDSTKLLAAAYAIYGDLQNADRVFEMAGNRIEEINFKKVQTIECRHSDVEQLYKNSSDYLIAEKEICLQEAKEYDCLSIKMTKEDLLEAIDYGRKEEI